MADDRANGDRHARYGAGARALGGAVAGLIAAVPMALVAMIRAAAGGLGFWLPMKNIAALFYGVDALIEGGSAAFVGILIHLVVGAVAGLIFGLVVGHRLNVFTALVAGLVWGVAVWAINTWLILPWANEVMLDRVMVAPVWWFVYHLVFGGLLLLVPPLVRAFGHRESRRRESRRRESSTGATRPST